ncbi:hypothetical protein Ancab_013437 [Ancistrocladus abbreviatus]
MVTGLWRHVLRRGRHPWTATGGGALSYVQEFLDNERCFYVTQAMTPSNGFKIRGRELSAHFHLLLFNSNCQSKKVATSQCFNNPPTPVSSGGAGGGTVQQIGGLKTYVTGPNDSKLAVLLISDIFGYEAPNLRKLADRVAAVGFLVVVPDFFYGDPVKVDDPNFDREAWKRRHVPGKGCEDARSVIAELRSRGVSCIGAAGFCWGGVVVVKLAKFDDIQAGVVLHPGHLSIDDIHKVKVPLSILGAEIDHASPPEQLKQFGEILAAKSGIDSYVKIFPGVSHGWSVRYNLEDESAVKSAEEAQSDMLDWFVKYVK